MTVTVAAAIAALQSHNAAAAAAAAAAATSSSSSSLSAGLGSNRSPPSTYDHLPTSLGQDLHTVHSVVNLTRMGRRKQHCPQKTGLNAEGPPGGNPGGAESSPSNLTNLQERESSSSPDSRSHASRDTPPMNDSNQNPWAFKMSLNGASAASPPLGASKAPKLPGNEEALANLLKSNPLLGLNPALLSLNPSLYAVQLAQLQAAQLLSQSVGFHKSGSEGGLPHLDEESNFRKRKLPLPDEEMESGGGGVLNLSKRSPLSSPKIRAESPLDLSGNSGMTHKRPSSSSSDFMSPAKMPKMEMPPWATGAFPFLNPFLAVSSSGGMSLPHHSVSLGMPPTSPSLNTSPPSTCSTTSENRNPLERMSEIAKGSHAANAKGGPRQSAWQSQWISRGPEANKDIFKCVWCKDSFPSLQSLTTHMKETKHFGSSIPPSPTSPQMSVRPPSSLMMTSPTTAVSTHFSPSAGGSLVKAPHYSHTNNSAGAATHSSASPSPMGGAPNPKQQRDILKEQLPLPRKLVRGQDVWLGRGEQQTRDILKCMWCGESFRSLDLMTKHMQETKHYTKVISQEQLVSWKSADSQVASPNHVNAVLTCKVCEQAFSTLKELSDHMVKNNHCKEQSSPVSTGLTSPVSSGGNNPNGGNTRGGSNRGATGLQIGPLITNGSPGSQGPMGGTPPTGGQSAKEKRKKSLPVRKLLELERAQQEMTGQFKPSNEETPGKISCEKCGEKILMHMFVDHIRQCVGPLNLPRSNASSFESLHHHHHHQKQQQQQQQQQHQQQLRQHRQTPSASPPASTPPGPCGSELGKGSPSPRGTPKEHPASLSSFSKEEPKSILGSLEKMVQSNFGTKTKAGPDNNMSILQRLGIDEGVDYSKPLVDPMAMFRPPSSSALASVAAAAAASGFALFPLLRSGCGGGVGVGGSEISKTALSSSSNNSACSSPDQIKPSGVVETTRMTGTSIKPAESPVKSPASDDAKSPVSRTGDRRLNDKGDEDDGEDGDGDDDDEEEDEEVDMEDHRGPRNGDVEGQKAKQQYLQSHDDDDDDDVDVGGDEEGSVVGGGDGRRVGHSETNPLKVADSKTSSREEEVEVEEQDEREELHESSPSPSSTTPLVSGGSSGGGVRNRGRASQREINEDEKDEDGKSQPVKKERKPRGEGARHEWQQPKEDKPRRNQRDREEDQAEKDQDQVGLEVKNLTSDRMDDDKDEMVTHNPRVTAFPIIKASSPPPPDPREWGLSAAAPKSSSSPRQRSRKRHNVDDDQDDIKDTSPDQPQDEDHDRGLNDSSPKGKTVPGAPAKKKSHPLAALQLLCDKTEKTPKTPVTSTCMYGTPTDPGAILAFSWACNQAVVNDSLLKCPFCDTPFISKGAYRHHLSKMHFVKDGSSPDPRLLMSRSVMSGGSNGGGREGGGGGGGGGGHGHGSHGGHASGGHPPSHGHRGSPGGSGQAGGGSGGDGNGGAADGGDNSQMKEENAQSKFQKYSQLAKQLSCSTQP